MATPQKKVLHLKKPASLNPTHDEKKISLSSIVAQGIGFDIHKASIAVCVSAQLNNGQIIVQKEHIFRHDPIGLEEMCHFLLNYQINPTYLMECTGVYHISVFRKLNQEFPNFASRIIAMNPLLVHNRIADLGNKNDRADARSLSSLAFYHQILQPSYVGNEEFFSLRDLIRTYHKNNSRVNRHRNRIHRQLHVVNQKFPFELSNEWALLLLDRYISQEWTLEAAYLNLLEDLEKANKGKVLKRFQEEITRNADIVLTEAQRFLLQYDLMELLSVLEANALLLTRAENRVIKDTLLKRNYQKLLQIPGFGPITVLTILTEIGDYTRFKSIDAFVKFCGVIPTIDHSGEHQKRGHINRFTNKHLRYVLSQAAGRVINRKARDSDLGDYAYKQRYIKKKPYKKACISVANKMARTMFHVLTNLYHYDPTFDLTQKKRKRIKKKLDQNKSVLDSHYTRALRRDIQTFLVSHSELLNSTSRYHLVAGFQRLIRKANYKEGKRKKGHLQKKNK